MASAFVGKYLHDKCENMVEYYKTLGMPDAEIEKYKTPWRTNEIEVDGNNVVITTNKRVVYSFDKEMDEELANGHKVKSIASMDGPKLVIKSTSPDGRKGTRTFELYDQGVLVSLKLEGSPVVAKMFYKRA